MATLTGDAGNNTLTGTSGNDSISGLDGDDKLNGVNGNDSIDGGDGNDSLSGDNGNDTVLGGPGADTLADWLGANSLDGGSGNDRFVGVAFSGTSTGADTITGGTGSDVYAVAVTIGTAPLADTIIDFETGTGGDVIDVSGVSFGLPDPDSNNNPFVGLIRLVQSGADTLFQINLNGNGSASDWRTALTLKNTTKGAFTAANFTGHLYNFDPQTTGVVHTGDAGNNSLVGLNGDDTVFGNDGNDSIGGLDGNDLLSGGNGNDLIYGDSGQDTLLGGAGNDTFYYPSGNDSVDGGDGNDSINSGTGNNTILGGAGADSIDDVYGANLVDGGDGDDRFINVSYTDSTEGSDTFSGGAGRDIYVFPYQSLTGPITSDRIADFQTGASGDVLDIANPMVQLSGFPENANAFLDGYLRLLQNGPDVLLQVDANGPTGGSIWTTLLTLQNCLASSFTADNFAAPNDFNPQSRMGSSLTGDSGANTLVGSPNNDTISGNAGNDSIDAAAGNDSIDAGDGNDSVNGRAGNDTILGGNGNDGLGGFDYTGNDWLDGGAGDDTLTPGGGDNTLIGGLGMNFLYGGPGANLIDGSQGNSDRLLYTFNTDGVDANLTLGRAIGPGGNIETLIGIERVYGGQGNDTLTGDQFSNFLAGEEGDDSIFGAGGDDSLEGYTGNNTLDGGPGIDSASGWFQTSTTDFSFTFQSGGTNSIGSSLFLNIEKLNFSSGSGNDSIVGGSDNDTLLGFTGNDSINGADGNDSLSGDSGNDTLTGGAGHDTFSAATFGGGITHITDFGVDDLIQLNPSSTFLGTAPFTHAYGQVRYFVSGPDTRLDFDTNSDAVADWTIVLDNFQLALGETFPFSHLLVVPQIVTGSAGNDVLSGTIGADTIFGADGNDTITGNAANDSLSGDNGNDSVSAGDGNDTVAGGAGNDTLLGDNGNDSIDGGDGNDSFYGNTSVGNDTVLGGAGDDTFYDVQGANSLSGNDGNDIFLGVSENTPFVGHPGADTISGGPGNDTFELTISPYYPLVPDTIADFQTGPQGDLVDPTDDSLYWQFYDLNSNPFYNGFLRLVQSGPDTLLQRDQDGPNGNSAWVTILTLQNTIATSFTAENFLSPFGRHFNPQPGPSINFSADNGDNTIWGSALGDTIFGNGGDDFLYGEPGDDSLVGGDGFDHLYGGSGNDTLIGGPVGYELNGGPGNDLLDGSAYPALAIFQTDTQGVYANLTTGLAVGPGSGNDTLIGIRDLWGGKGNDTLIGDALSNGLLDTDNSDDSISGNDGNDSIWSLGGNDTIDGGAGIDKLQLNGFSGDYFITQNGFTLTFVDTRTGSNDGTDIVSNVELFQFSPGIIISLAQLNISLAIESAGSTTLLTTSGHFYLRDSGGAGPTLKMGGNDVVAGQFGAWTPIAAETTGSGYEVAWKVTGANQYSVWTTDANGNYTGNLVPGVAGSDPVLVATESFFQQDINGDGVISSAYVPIETHGATTLATANSHFYLQNGAGSGPSVKFGGADVVAGQFGAWTPIAAETTGSGYEIAWKVIGADQYSVWSTDANGNYTGNLVPGVTGNDPALVATEASFQQDINGDGVISSAHVPIETHGVTTLATGNNHFYLQDNNGAGPSLKMGGNDVSAGQFGGWTPIAAETTGSGYEVAWKVTGLNQYSVWSTDANGNYLANLVPTVTGNDPALLSTEASFQQDLNGDGLISAGHTAIETHGVTTLAMGSNHFYLQDNTGAGPSLKLGGADVSAGQFGGWTPIAAEATGSGYEVAWKVTGADQYSVWGTDANGNYTGNLVPSVPGNDPALAAIEASFHQDLNGDGLF